MDWYLPKAKQRTVPPEMVNDYSGAKDPDSVVITFLGPMAEVLREREESQMDYDLYDQNGNYLRLQKPIPRHANNQRWVCSREVLLKLLEPMTSDHVIFELSEDYPARILGQIGDRACAAFVAPRIGDE